MPPDFRRRAFFIILSPELPLTVGVVIDRSILGRLIVPVAVQQAVTQGGQADQTQQPAGSAVNPPVTSSNTTVDMVKVMGMHVSHFIYSISELD